MVTNVPITYEHLQLFVTFPNKKVAIKDIHVYQEDKVEFTLPLAMVFRCWLKLNNKYQLNVRKKETFEKKEVFAIKRKKEYGDRFDIYDLYIPSSALGAEYQGTEIKNMGDYDYIYRTYTISGCCVEYLGYYPEEKFKPVNDDMIKVCHFDSYRPTNEKAKLDKLAKDIEETCNLRVDTWKLKEVLKHYKITKIRRKLIEE